MKIGINLTGPGLGDNLILSSLPENYFLNTNERLIDVSNNHIFDYNPYILRGVSADSVFTTQEIQDTASRLTRKTTGEDLIKIFSIPDRHRHFFNLEKCFLRHPRLYIYEDIKTEFNKVTIHTSGKTIGGELSDKVIDQIIINYKDYQLIQVGGKNDKTLPGCIDKRGLSLFDTAKEIASSAIFIGVDSSNFHIASCYPKVRKKLILNYFNEEQFLKYTPLFTDAVWWEFNIETYSNYDYDVGVSMSYKKI